MKKLLLPIVIIISGNILKAQKVLTFKESEYLIYDDQVNMYLNNKSSKPDTTVRLIAKKKLNATWKLNSISTQKQDTIKHFKEEENHKPTTVRPIDYKLDRYINEGNIKTPIGINIPQFHRNRLYGDFVQDKGVLKFYPYKFNDGSKADTTYLDSINMALDKVDQFILTIPDRMVIKTHFTSYQIGVLTLPYKVYTNQVDSVANEQFDINLNVMIGRKRGKKGYSYYAESAKEYYSFGQSLNAIVGISTLEATPDNTRDKLTKKLNIGVLSYGVAYGLHYGSVGLFIAAGLDTPLSKFGRNWVYKDTVWLGFGLGLGL